jgi:transposase
MKNNKLIAEFMELEASPKYNPKEYYIKEYNSGEWYLPEEMQYHNSWDWLIPVANEIIKSRDEQNADWDLTDLKYALQTTNIEYVYKAVVEFINQLNNNNYES